MDSDAIQDTKAPRDPIPSAWLSAERKLLLQKQFSSSRGLLRQAGLWDSALSYWVKCQVSTEVIWTPEKEDMILSPLSAKWREKFPSKSKKITQQELYSKLRVSPAAAEWSRQHWGHRLQSLYLQRKSKLDKASCRILRVSNKNLSLELYHRLKAGELSFTIAVAEHSTGPRRYDGGLIPLQPLESMPYGLGSILRDLRPGKITMPLRLSNDYCIIKLEQFTPSELNTDTEDLLLREQLELWIETVVNLIEDSSLFENPLDSL